MAYASAETPPLARSRPSAQSVDPMGLIRLLDAVDAANIELHSLMVLRHGYVVAEGWWAPYSAGQRQLLYSVSKSFTAVAAGLAISEGRFTLDDPVIDHFPELLPDDIDPRFAGVLVRDALSMATGHETDPLGSVLDLSSGGSDPLLAYFTLPPERGPRTVFTYNQLATYSVARMVEATTGQRLIDYLTPRLFRPLGITEQTWMSWNDGDLGYSGLSLTTESMAKFGLLCLRHGAWGTQQLVPADWIRQATSLQLRTDQAHRGSSAPIDPVDWQRGYGYQFWMSRNGYRAHGAYGQLVLVWPEQDAVVVTTAGTTASHTLLDLFTDILLPAMSDTLDDAKNVAAQEDQAQDRLSRLSLPLPPDVGGNGSGVFRRAGSRDAVPQLITITLVDGPTGRWLELPDGSASLPVGSGCWRLGRWPAQPNLQSNAGSRPAGVEHPASTRESLPVASAGGWLPDGSFEARMVMVSTPHTLRISLDPLTSTFSVHWQTEPLHGQSPGDYAVATH